MPNVAKLVAKYLGKQKDLGITAATLTLKTPGSRTVGAETSGTNPTSVSYPCKAFVDVVNKLMDGTLVAEGRSVLSVLGGTLPAGVKPKPTATIVHKGITYKVTRVATDPAGAVHQCEVAS